MKTIIKSIVLSIIVFQSPLFASDLPDRGGKFGKITKSTTNIKNNTKKSIKGRRLATRSSYVMRNALRTRTSNYGIYGTYKVYGYTHTIKNGRTYPASHLYTQLYIKIGYRWHRLCNKGGRNRAHFNPSCTYRWFNSSKPNYAYAKFAARVDGRELRGTRYAR